MSNVKMFKTIKSKLISRLEVISVKMYDPCDIFQHLIIYNV